MKFVYVGFKGKNNPSSYIVSRFQESFLLTNSYSGIDRDIQKIQDCYDGILLFGLNPKLKNCVQIELLSRWNYNDLKSKFNLSDLEKSFKDMSIILSVTPSNYLCNYAYYRLSEKFEGNVILIHIPFSKEFADQIINCLK